MRQYTTAARWRLREFNELPHYFNRRLSNSHKKATKYMDQFQISRFDSFARLISFIAGSLAVVLIGITIVNEDLLMHFEITSGKSVIWYVGLLGVVLTICRSMMPDSTKSSDPEKLMNDIAEYTHYMPRSWKGKLYTDSIRKEFGSMFNYKFTILFKELVSVITTPFVLLVTLPKCTDQLVEFFREFSVHVDGIGYVCSFALFDFQRHGNNKYGGASGGGTNKRQHTRQGKMEKSFISFVSNNPNWTPHEDGSLYLSKMQDFEVSMSRQIPTPIPNASMFLRRPYEPTVLREEDELDESIQPRTGIMSILNQYYDIHVTQ
jgi:autophagy-related protein 9